jgi:hypothetical protein
MKVSGIVEIAGASVALTEFEGLTELHLFFAIAGAAMASAAITRPAARISAVILELATKCDGLGKMSGLTLE